MENKQRLIDAHHHFWALDGSLSYPWLEDKPVKDFFLGDYDIIRRRFLPVDLMRLVPKEYRLVGSIHCEAEAVRSAAIAESQWINQLSEQEYLPSAHVGWAPFGQPDCEEYLDKQLTSPLFRGVRVKPITARNPEELDQVRGELGSLQDNRWCEGLTLLEERRLSWDLRVPAWHLLEAAECLEQHPSLTVVVNHCGLPWDRSPKGLQKWREGMNALASNPNVCVKLSELGCPGQKWEAVDNVLLLIEILQIFGTERCLYASNAPVSGIQVSYTDWLALVEKAISQVAPEARDDVLWRNALNWYRLKLPEIEVSKSE